MVIDYAYDSSIYKKCELLFALNTAGVFAAEKNLALKATDNEYVMSTEVKVALRLVYGGSIRRGDSRSIVRDLLNQVHRR